MNIKILNLKEAAEFLNLSAERLRQKAANGKIPGVKLGKSWCFIEADLVEHMRSLYPNSCKVSQGVLPRGEKLWHSAKEIISGGSASVSTANAYNNLLGLATK